MSRLWLVAILLLTGFTRLYMLGSLPLGFTPDEATFGYDAWSLLRTGRDEWGTPFWQLPLTGLKSFGDYKLPLYAFLAVPAVGLFGLSEFSTRLPNAFLGIISVAVMYVLGVMLGGRKTGLIAAFLFCISPWNISLSRGAFEAYTGLFFILLGLALFISGKNKLGSLILGLGMYAYHTPRLIIPVLLVPLLSFFVPRRKIVPGLGIFILVSAAAVISFFHYNPRTADVSLIKPGTDLWASVVTVLPAAVANYSAYFSPRFLFQNGSGEATYGMLPGTGVLYLIEVLFLAGFVFRILTRPGRRLVILLVLLLVSPLPASLTTGVGLAANRAAPFLIPLTLISAVGAVSFLGFFRPFVKQAAGLSVLILLVSFGLFINRYRLELPAVSAKAMGFGLGRLIPYIRERQSDYQEIRFSRSLSEPHIYLAFYLKIDPAFYQASSRYWLEFENQGYKFLDQYDGYSLGSYTFGNLYYGDPVDIPVLYVGKPDDFPAGTDYLAASVYPDGTSAVVLAEKSPPL